MLYNDDCQFYDVTTFKLGNKLPFSDHVIGRGTFRRIIYLGKISYMKFEMTVLKICFYIKETMFVKDIIWDTQNKLSDYSLV